VLVVERLHLLIGNVDAQLLVRVNDEILETKNVENSDCTTFTAEKNKQSVIYYSAPPKPTPSAPPSTLLSSILEYDILLII